MSLANRPAQSEFDPYYARYVDLVPEGDVIASLRAQGDATAALVARVGEERGGHRYAPGKWSVREVLGHIADTERIMAYRALRVARGDATPLPGFDENVYVAAAGFDTRSLASIAAELRAVREATVHLLAGLEPRAVGVQGSANGSPITPRALAWIIAGHERHHLAILRERYRVA